MSKIEKKGSVGKGQTVAMLKRFARSEDGNLFVLAVPLIIIMAIWGGIAVDLMRFESRRAMLQGVTDRATLAAANLGQSQEPVAVVKDYFAKTGMADQLDGEPYVDIGYQRHEVSAKGLFDIDTFFMRYLDKRFNYLHARSASTAVQGVGAVEVSLVLDLSGSMYSVIKGVSPATRRIEKLRSAAISFVDSLLVPEFANRISLSLVPYSEQVNIGPTLFNALNSDRTHNFSHCLELPASSFSTTTFSTTTKYDQTQNVQFNTFGQGGFDSISGSTRNSSVKSLDQPVCPVFTYERVVPISQNRDLLVSNIQKYQPRAGTSIFLGLKWGATLLDPSFAGIIGALPTSVIDPVFADRPKPYEPDGTSGNKVRSLKYLVLMTDGYNDESRRLKNQYYADPSQRLYWAHHSFAWASNYYNRNARSPNVSKDKYTLAELYYTPAQGVNYMNSMCTATKDAGIVIYAISMSGDDDRPEAVSGRAEMAKCASTPNHYFATSGKELDEIFARIAKQITDLRLTQ